MSEVLGAQKARFLPAETCRAAGQEHMCVHTHRDTHRDATAFEISLDSGAGEGGGARDISEVFSSSRVPSSLSSVGALMVRYRGV